MYKLTWQAMTPDGLIEMVVFFMSKLDQTPEAIQLDHTSYELGKLSVAQSFGQARAESVLAARAGEQPGNEFESSVARLSCSLVVSAS